jgi:hypothetical protein
MVTPRMLAKLVRVRVCVHVQSSSFAAPPAREGPKDLAAVCTRAAPFGRTGVFGPCPWRGGSDALRFIEHWWL